MAQPESPSTKSEKKWEEESDARTLADAAVIRADPERMKNVAAGAKRILKEEKERAEEQEGRSNQLKKIAGTYSSVKEARAAAEEEVKGR